jgi:hypothetical protein
MDAVNNLCHHKANVEERSDRKGKVEALWHAALGVFLMTVVMCMMERHLLSSEVLKFCGEI